MTGRSEFKEWLRKEVRREHPGRASWRQLALAVAVIVPVSVAIVIVLKLLGFE